MTDFGIALDIDRIVLTQGRDFKWSLENLDENKDPTNFPAGDLFFEIATRGEHNGRGHIDLVGANGGTYVLDRLDGTGSPSSSLPFDASQSVVKQAIEGLSGVGVGNVSVIGYYTPQWIFTVDWSDAMPLSAGVVELFNATVHAAFSAMAFLTGGLGVTLDGHYESSSFVFRLTYKGSLLEEELINFVAGVIATIISTINGALTAIEQFSGEIADISLIYAPLRHFDYEFINDRELTPMPELTAVSSLSGHSPTIAVVQDAPGRAPFTIWQFDISGHTATLKIESPEADAISARTRWQLVFLPDGEAAGGDPVALGTVVVQR